MRLRLKRCEAASLASGFGFGLHIQDRGSAPVLQIERLAADCEAERSGLVRPGDIILRINNVDVSRCTFDEALQTLASTPVGSYASFIVRAPYGFTTRLVTTFEEDGTPRTIRITERTTRKASTTGPFTLTPATSSAKMVNAEATSNGSVGSGSNSSHCATCQKTILLPNGQTPSTAQSLLPLTPNMTRRK